MITISAELIEELKAAGLLMGLEPQVTPKGREWLRQLEDVETKQVADDWAADFVESTNAISR